MTIAVEERRAQENVAARDRSPERVAGLITCASQGDGACWEQLVVEFDEMLWGIARAHRLGEADACDVVQATWVKLLRHIRNLRDPTCAAAWLATTARRECLRVLRGAGKHIRLEEEAAGTSDDPSPGEELVVAERDGALWRGFARLPGRDQSLLRLLMAEPRPSYEVISAVLSMPVGSIGPTRARALERLRRELAADGTLELFL